MHEKQTNGRKTLYVHTFCMNLYRSYMYFLNESLENFIYVILIDYSYPKVIQKSKFLQKISTDSISC